MILFLVKAGGFVKFVEVVLLSGVKFLAAPFLSFKFGFGFVETVIFTTFGGISGIIFFYFLSEIILKLFRKLWPRIKAYFSKPKLQSQQAGVTTGTKGRKRFSKRNKFIILTRRKYGLWGIAALTPIFFSIPLGTFLANKYYRNKRNVLFTLAMSVVCWSVIMSALYAVFKVKPF